MKLLSYACALVLAFSLTACGSKSEQAKTESTAGEQAASPETAPAAGEMTPAAAETGPMVGSMAAGTKVTLTGATGCGHCNFTVGTTCAPAIKTTTGEIVLIDGVPENSELVKTHEAPKNIQLTGTVAPSPDGLTHVKLESYQLN